MIVIGIIGISISAVLVKYSTAPSAVTAAYRLIWTILLMTPVTFGKKEVRTELFSIDKKSLGLCILSGLFLAVHFVFWFESLNYTSIASSSTIVSTEVIWVSIIFCLFMKGKMSWKAIATIAVTFMGSVVIAYSDSTAGGLHLFGDLLALIASFGMSIYTLIGRVVREKVSTTVYTYMLYVSCAVVLVITCIVQGHSLFEYGMSPVIIGLLLSLFSTILGHSIFSWCLKFFSPSFVAAAKLCQPVVAAIFAAFLFQEIPTPLQVLGGVMIIGGVAYYSRLETKQ